MIKKRAEDFFFFCLVRFFGVFFSSLDCDVLHRPMRSAAGGAMALLGSSSSTSPLVSTRHATCGSLYGIHRLLLFFLSLGTLLFLFFPTLLRQKEIIKKTFQFRHFPRVESCHLSHRSVNQNLLNCAHLFFSLFFSSKRDITADSPPLHSFETVYRRVRRAAGDCGLAASLSLRSCGVSWKRCSCIELHRPAPIATFYSHFFILFSRG